MKFFRTLMMFASLGIELSAGNVTLITDPLTGLPVDPNSDPGMNLGNAPTKMADMQICSSKMQANRYDVFDKVDATVAWYEAHLPGFHKAHGYSNGRSRDSFYNDAGTQVVTVTGDPGPEGQNVGVHGVVYYAFRPALPAKTIIGFTQEKITCR